MDDAALNDSDQVFRLVYRSRVLIPSENRKNELGAIFSSARSFNKKQGITGALLVSGDYFVQTLEGEEAAVRELYAHIQNDPRHDSVALVDTAVAGRVFGKWAMAKVADDGQQDIPLIAGRDGAVRAADRPTTPEQDSVLDAMRDAAQQ